MEERRGVNWLLAAGVLGLVGLASCSWVRVRRAAMLLAQDVAAAPTAAMMQIPVKQGHLTDPECDLTHPNEWQFRDHAIDNESDAPATIHVTWANGQSRRAPDPPHRQDRSLLDDAYLTAPSPLRPPLSMAAVRSPST
jgi:hypothetical protein